MLFGRTYSGAETVMIEQQSLFALKSYITEKKISEVSIPHLTITHLSDGNEKETSKQNLLTMCNINIQVSFEKSSTRSFIVRNHTFQLHVWLYSISTCPPGHWLFTCSKKFCCMQVDFDLTCGHKFLIRAVGFWEKLHMELQCMILYVVASRKTILKLHLDTMLVLITKMKNDMITNVEFFRW